MNCARCGTGDVSVRKDDNEYYCSRCGVARDWEMIISIAQGGRNLDASIEFEMETALAPADPFAS
jgi:hypothetical protein